MGYMNIHMHIYRYTIHRQICIKAVSDIIPHSCIHG